MSATIFSDTTWYEAAAHPGLRTLGPNLRDWLQDPGSLTQRLRQHLLSFNVQVLRHQPAELTLDELAKVAPWGEHTTQCREVLLCDGKVPAVFARSIIPQAERGLLHKLQHIGTQPLGEALFTHSDVDIGPFEVAYFAPNSQVGLLNQQLTGISESLWGRRRNFYVENTPVLVAEVFLSTAPCYN